jgi:hypothetical protein
MECHHVDGRGDAVRESPEMCALLCRAHPSFGLGCHERVQRFLNPALVASVRWAAAERLAGHGHHALLADLRADGYDAHEALRTLIDAETDRLAEAG